MRLRLMPGRLMPREAQYEGEAKSGPSQKKIRPPMMSSTPPIVSRMAMMVTPIGLEAVFKF